MSVCSLDFNTRLRDDTNVSPGHFPAQLLPRGLLVPVHGRGAEEGRGHCVHVPRVKLQHDAGLKGGGQPTDEP